MGSMLHGTPFYQPPFLHPDRNQPDMMPQFSNMRGRLSMGGAPPPVDSHLDFFPSLTDLDRMHETANLEKSLELAASKELDADMSLGGRPETSSPLPFKKSGGPTVYRMMPSDSATESTMQLKNIIPDQDIGKAQSKREGQEYTWQEIEEEKEKHKSAEKKRRGEMNELLQRLKSLLPLKPTTRMTKKNILFQSIQYITKLKTTNNQMQKEMTDLRSDKTKDEGDSQKRG